MSLPNSFDCRMPRVTEHQVGRENTDMERFDYVLLAVVGCGLILVPLLCKWWYDR
jgi:hypothetical protein